MTQMERGGEKGRYGGGQTMVKKRSTKMQLSLTILNGFTRMNQLQRNYSLYPPSTSTVIVAKDWNSRDIIMHLI